MTFLVIVAAAAYLAFGAVCGQAIVRLNVDNDGFWPERPVKKIGLFLIGLVFWPVIMWALIIWVLHLLIDPAS
jgi:hypothetical protein